MGFNLGAFAGGMAGGLEQGARARHYIASSNAEEQKLKDDEAYRKALAEASQDGGVDQVAAVQRPQAEPAPERAAPPVETAQTAQAVPAGPSGGIGATQQSPAAAPGEQQQKAQRQFNTLADALNYTTRVAQINMKYGKGSLTDLVNLIKMKKTFEDEGMEQAIGRLQAGDYQGALDAYNSTGEHRATFKAPPQAGEFEYAGQKIPTVLATIVDQNGKEYNINTAQTMAAKIGLDKTVQMLYQQQAKNESLGIQQGQLDEQIRHNKEVEGLAATKNNFMRDRGPGSGRGKWIQNADGEWQYVQMGETAQGPPKETINENEDGTLNVYDEGTGTARTVYTEDQARARAQSDTEAWKRQQSKGMFNFGPKDEEVKAYQENRYNELMRGSQRPARRSSPPPAAGGLGGGDNNVGNMRVPGSSTGFQQFDSPEEALSAIDKQLKIYGSRDGVDTLAGVISKWSPPNENATAQLIDNASRATGIKPDQKIDLSNPAVRAVLTGAIIRQEGNQAYLNGIGRGKQQGGKSPSTSREQQSTPPPDVAQGQGPQPSPSPATKGVNFLNDPNSPLAGSVDFGSMVGKPIAATAGFAGKTVGDVVDALRTKLSPEQYNKVVEFAKNAGSPEDMLPVLKKLGINMVDLWKDSANPAKNTEAYMANRSSKNLNQYFR